MHSINTLGVAAFSLACLLGTSALRAQSTATAGAPGTKVAVINVLVAIGSTAEGKQAAIQLQTQFASRQQELESMNKQLDDLQRRLSAGQPAQSDEEKARLAAQANRLTQRMDRKKNQYQEDLNAAQREILDNLGRKMMDVLDRYAQDNGYVAVFDSSAQNSPILYAAKNTDVTQDLIRLYDQAHPVKGTSAAPTTKPAPAPQPATPPSPKPQ